MNWIFDHLQIVVILLLAVGSLVKTLLEGKARRAQQDEEPAELPDRPVTQRRSMPSVPPPLSHTNTPALSSMAAVEAANEAAKILKHQQDLAERLRQIRETKATTTGDAAATRTRIAAKNAKSPLPEASPTFRRRLKDRGEIRRAIVMREILDRPVSLR
jgi:transposase